MKSSQVKSGRKTAEVKATIPVKSPVKVMNLSADTTTITQDVGCSVHETCFIGLIAQRICKHSWNLVSNLLNMLDILMSMTILEKFHPLFFDKFYPEYMYLDSLGISN